MFPLTFDSFCFSGRCQSNGRPAIPVIFFLRIDERRETTPLRRVGTHCPHPLKERRWLPQPPPTPPGRRNRSDETGSRTVAPPPPQVAWRILGSPGPPQRRRRRRQRRSRARRTPATGRCPPLPRCRPHRRPGPSPAGQSVVNVGPPLIFGNSDQHGILSSN